MPSNWRGVAERGDKVRSRDRGRGGTHLREGGLWNLKTQAKMQGDRHCQNPRLTTQSLVHELITFGHMSCSCTENAFSFSNASVPAQSWESVRSSFRTPLRFLGRSAIHPYVMAAATDSGLKQCVDTQAHAQDIWCWQTGSRHTRYQSTSIKRQLWIFIRVQTILITWRVNTEVTVSLNIPSCRILKNLSRRHGHYIWF